MYIKLLEENVEMLKKNNQILILSLNEKAEIIAQKNKENELLASENTKVLSNINY